MDAAAAQRAELDTTKRTQDQALAELREALVVWWFYFLIGV